MSEWKSIETAPHDKEVLLLVNVAIGGQIVVQGCWFCISDEEQGWIDWNGNVVDTTHWMPIPKPPEDA